MVWKEVAFPFDLCGHVMGGPTLLNWPSSKPGQRILDNEGDWVADVTAVTATYVEFDINEDACAGYTGSGEGRSFPPLDVRPYIKDSAIVPLSNNDLQRNVFKWAEKNVQPYYSEGGPDAATVTAWKAVGTMGWFPRLRLRAVAKNGGPMNSQFPVMATSRTANMLGSETTIFQFNEIDGNPNVYREFRSKLYEDLGNKFRVYWPSAGAVAQPIVGDQIRFYVRALDVSEANPILIAAHPVDILTDLWGQYDIDYDLAAAAAVKAALGEFVVALRITEAMSLKDAQSMLCGGFGMAWRFAPNGLRYLFTTRVRPTLSGTITLDDLASDDGVIWENEETSRVFSASYKWKRFTKWPGDEDGKTVDRALDGVMPYDVGPIIFQTDDLESKPFGARDEQYDIPGSVYELAAGDAAPNWTVANHADITANLTAPILDQFGRGAITTTLNLTHCVLVQEGEDWELELPHRPGFDEDESPVAQRGLVERVQCVARTPRPWGSTVTLVRVPQVNGGIVPTTPNVGTAEALPLGFVVLDATATGGNLIDEGDVATTFTAYPYYTSFILAANNNDYYGVLGASVVVDYYEGAAEPAEGLQTRYGSAWDGLNAIEIGGFSPTSKVWYRTQVRLADGYIFAMSAWASVQLTNTTQAGSPDVALIADGSFNVSATVVAPPTTERIYVAASTTTYPSSAVTLATTPIAGQTATVSSIIATLAAGQTAYVTAIAEDYFGNISIVSTSSYTRAASGGGSTPIYTAYDPFCPPASPSSLDDEFAVDGSGVPSGWTNVGALTPTITVANRRMLLTTTAATGGDMAAIEKTLPSGQFTLVCHVSLVGRLQFNSTGIYIRNSTSGLILANRMVRVDNTNIGNTQVNGEKYSSFTTRTSSFAGTAHYQPSAWLRISSDGTVVYLAVSFDGVDFINFHSETISTYFSGGNLPNRVGITLSSFSVNAPSTAFRAFRYFSTFNSDIGRSVGVG
jgi:hypothetical protein